MEINRIVCFLSKTKCMASDIGDIKELSETIAYNTEKTAYYSKINAELTDALGFMVALK